MKNDVVTCAHCNQPKKSGSFLSGMLMGMMLGGALAVLYADKKGRKKAQQLIEESNKILKNLGQSTADMTAQIREQAQSIEDQVRTAAGVSKPMPSFTQNMANKFFKKNGKKLK